MLTALLAAAVLSISAPPCPEGFTPLFNGTDLSGWVNANCKPTTFTVRDGMIFCDGDPNGFIRTERTYENFVLELEWKHEKESGNAGLFVWADPDEAAGVPFPKSIEVQVMMTPDVKDKEGRLLYTGQGDIFSIHGARMTPDRPHPAGWERCLPSERRTKPAGEWNHYRVTCDRGAIKLEINGKEVSGGHSAHPANGFLCLEAEGSPIWFRNLCVKELPPTKLEPKAGLTPLSPEPEPTAGNGWVPLLGGSLAAWNLDGDLARHWTLENGSLRYDGKGDSITTKESFGDVELLADWRWTGPSQGTVTRPYFDASGHERKNPDGSPMSITIEERDSGIYLRGSSKSQVNIWEWPAGSGEVWGYRTDRSQPAEVRAACTPRMRADRPVGEWNRFKIRMVGETLDVWLNGQHVVAGARLPGVPASGPITLQHHGSSIEFANVYVRPIAKK
jgi:hypothetical protein